MPEDELPSLPHEIQAPEDYLPGTPLWVWIVLAVIAILLLTGAFFLIRSLRKSSGKSSLVYSQNLFHRANEQLSNLTSKAGSIPLALFATSVSLILRDCLSKVLRDPALYETDEELALRSASLENVPESMRAILHKLANAKYSPSFVDEAQAKDFADEATSALRDFHTAQNQPKEEAAP